MEVQLCKVTQLTLIRMKIRTIKIQIYLSLRINIKVNRYFRNLRMDLMLFNFLIFKIKHPTTIIKKDLLVPPPIQLLQQMQICQEIHKLILNRLYLIFSLLIIRCRIHPKFIAHSPTINIRYQLLIQLVYRNVKKQAKLL